MLFLRHLPVELLLYGIVLLLHGSYTLLCRFVQLVVLCNALLPLSAQKSVAAMQQQYDAIQQQLNRQMSQKQQSDNALLARIDMLKTIIDLSDIYESNKDEFYKRCRSYMNLCNTNKHSFVKDIREIASLYKPGFVEILLNRYPGLNDDEIDFACLTMLGFDSNQLRILFNHNHVQSTYGRRTRLRKKFSLTNNEDLRDFLLSLS